MSVNITRSTEKDIKEIMYLLEEYYITKNKSFPEITVLREMLSLILDETEEQLQFIARFDNIPVGYATLNTTFSLMKGKNILVIDELFVHPNYHGMGIGKLLFRHCEEFSKMKGFEDLVWVPQIDNFPARVRYDELNRDDKELMFHNL